MQQDFKFFVFWTRIWRAWKWW